MKKIFFAASLRMSGVQGGGGPVQPWRTLRANAHYLSSYYIVFHSVIYNSVCGTQGENVL